MQENQSVESKIKLALENNNVSSLQAMLWSESKGLWKTSVTFNQANWNIFFQSWFSLEPKAMPDKIKSVILPLLLKAAENQDKKLIKTILTYINIPPVILNEFVNSLSKSGLEKEVHLQFLHYLFIIDEGSLETVNLPEGASASDLFNLVLCLEAIPIACVIEKFSSKFSEFLKSENTIDFFDSNFCLRFFSFDKDNQEKLKFQKKLVENKLEKTQLIKFSYDFFKQKSLYYFLLKMKILFREINFEDEFDKLLALHFENLNPNNTSYLTHVLGSLVCLSVDNNRINPKYIKSILNYSEKVKIFTKSNAPYENERGQGELGENCWNISFHVKTINYFFNCAASKNDEELLILLFKNGLRLLFPELSGVHPWMAWSCEVQSVGDRKKFYFNFNKALNSIYRDEGISVNMLSCLFSQLVKENKGDNFRRVYNFENTQYSSGIEINFNQFDETGRKFQKFLLLFSAGFPLQFKDNNETDLESGIARLLFTCEAENINCGEILKQYCLDLLETTQSQVFTTSAAIHVFKKGVKFNVPKPIALNLIQRGFFNNEAVSQEKIKNSLAVLEQKNPSVLQVVSAAINLGLFNSEKVLSDMKNLLEEKLEKSQKSENNGSCVLN